MIYAPKKVVTTRKITQEELCDDPIALCEELDISRRNAFRLKKKALAFAAARLPDWLLTTKERQSS